MTDFDICGLQNYKETCMNIGYDCITDTIYAQCSSQTEDSNDTYPFSSLSSVSFCEGNIANLGGVLQCQSLYS